MLNEGEDLHTSNSGNVDVKAQVVVDINSQLVSLSTYHRVVRICLLGEPRN